jgi:hypothetical protein
MPAAAVRIAAQVYNQLEDYERLAEAVLHIGAGSSAGVTCWARFRPEADSTPYQNSDRHYYAPGKE